MMHKVILGFAIILSGTLILPLNSYSQVPEIKHPVKFDVSIPLREMKPMKPGFWKKFTKNKEEREVPNRFKNIPPNYFAPSDPALQAANPGSNLDVPMVNPIINFDGIKNSANSGRVTPPDPNGDVGPNNYVQVVNCMLQMYDKTGVSVLGPETTSTIWSGFNGNWSGHNDGDAVVLYDENADRWLISQFAIDCAGTPKTEYQLVAISTTSNPTGSYYRYAFSFDYMPDYPKLSVWNDGYYLAVNRFNTNLGTTPFVGAAGCVLNRSKMLTGDATAEMVYFKTETLGGSGSGLGTDCYSMLPSDCDGTFPASGTPNYFTYINDNTTSGPSELRIWALHADWTTLTNSTFTFVTNLPVTAYTMLGTGTGVVSQQGTTNKLDGLGDRLMFRNQYRNFGTYASFVTCHSVNIGGNVAGVRWYEYRKTGTVWSVYQQSTYNPGDGKSRWLGSIAQNVNGDIGLAYTVSNSTMYPSIYFTGRKAADALNTMTITEGIIQTGAASMTGATRWGDYAALNVDPSDNVTFWTTNEYVGTYGGTWPWATRIASFKFSNQPSVATQNATAITLISATLNGTVNPNGLATTYHFEWGTTVAYGNNTATLPAGSGIATVPESANITGLTGGTTYHFRIDATNSDGTSYGNDFTFTPGAAAVTTTAASAITMTTATAGGNVTADGGASVTAKGTCWGTTANPTIAGSHTTDGLGTGVFTSSLTGLTANTVYHIRAYATNSTGTYYGSDLTFTTLCGTYGLPFSESFSATTIPSCWSQVDNQANGQIWQFGVITGYTPAPILTGNYAYLNSDAYGAGNSQNADLITPTLNMTGYTGVTLQFNHYFRSYTGSSATVSYSINNGTTWTTIQTWTATTANPAAFYQTIAALAGQSQVKIKWNYTGSYGYYWGVDDVLITGTSATPTLLVSPSSQNVPATAGSTSFTVNSNSSWTVLSDQSWCTVTPSGSGNGTITANYTANLLTTSRTASVTVTVTGISPVIVTVVQAGAGPTLSVTPSNQNVPATAGSTTFTVNSNSNWTVTSDQTWCTVTPSGTGNGTITANYTANGLTTQRVANITVFVVGLVPVIVTVTQAGIVATLSVTPSNQNVGPTIGSTNFTVNSNSSWTVTSNQTWCTVTPSGSGNGTIVANFTDNLTTSTRVANVTTTVASISPVTTTVTQAGAAPTLSVTPSNQNVAAPAGSTAFTVNSNSNWTVVSDQGWCTVTPSGSGNGTITANYTANGTTNTRVANITATVTGLGPVVVTVTQSASAPILNVTPNNQNVSPPAGTTTFNVTSNTYWTVVSDQAWCAPTSSGNGNGAINADYIENTTTLTRVANLTVTVSGLSPIVVTVTQSGAAPILMVSPADRKVAFQAGTTSFSVTSNTNWLVLSDQTWCTVTSTGNGNGTIIANYAENTDVSPRVANIQVSVSGLSPVTVTVSQDGFVGMPELTNEEISVVPNPTEGEFTINTKHLNGEILVVNIYDNAGRFIQSVSCKGKKSYGFDLSTKPKGEYYIRISAEGRTIVKKLILK